VQSTAPRVESGKVSRRLRRCARSNVRMLMIGDGTLLLSRSHISSLVTFKEYYDAVEAAFRSHGEGNSLSQGLLHLDSEGGEFHIKAGGLRLEHIYFGFKTNGGFYQNTRTYNLPNIIGTVALCDGVTGFPLAVMESGEITRQRTAAAAAVAAKYLARPDSKALTICGCGIQGRTQVKAMVASFPISRVFAFDVNDAQRLRFSEEVSRDLGIEVEPVEDLKRALAETDICVTCTPAHHYYVEAAHVRAGTFIAAMGADSPDKQEIDPVLLSSQKLVVDILEQCEQVGELHHAIAQGHMTRNDVHADLGQVVTGQKVGRTSANEITIFDATGTALQDVAAAAVVYKKAVARGAGTRFDFLS
jgi:alanine dehydrogenase